MAAVMNMHPLLISYDSETYFWDALNKKHKPELYYAKEMPCSTHNQISMDHTAMYIVHHKIIKDIHHYNPNMRLVFVVRDPVDRAISHFDMMKRNGMFKGISFEDHVCSDKEVDTRVLSASFYEHHLSIWLEVFSMDQFLIVSAEDLRYKPYEVILRVESFMNLDHEVSEDSFEYNATRGFFCFKINGKSNCLRKGKGRPHPVVAPECLSHLRDLFQPINQKFYELVGRDFGWND